MHLQNALPTNVTSGVTGSPVTCHRPFLVGQRNWVRALALNEQPFGRRRRRQSTTWSARPGPTRLGQGPAGRAPAGGLGAGCAWPGRGAQPAAAGWGRRGREQGGHAQRLLPGAVLVAACRGAGASARLVHPMWQIGGYVEPAVGHWVSWVAASAARPGAGHLAAGGCWPCRGRHGRVCTACGAAAGPASEGP